MLYFFLFILQNHLAFFNIARMGSQNDDVTQVVAGTLFLGLGFRLEGELKCIEYIEKSEIRVKTSPKIPLNFSLSESSRLSQAQCFQIMHTG